MVDNYNFKNEKAKIALSESIRRKKYADEIAEKTEEFDINTTFLVKEIRNLLKRTHQEVEMSDNEEMKNVVFNELAHISAITDDLESVGRSLIPAMYSEACEANELSKKMLYIFLAESQEEE